MPPRAWQPVLEGTAADRAWQVIEHVARALRDPPPPYDGHIVDDALRASLFAREAGFAVFYSYLARAKGAGPESSELRDLAASYLGTALDQVPGISTDRPQLSYGFTGTAWALQHLDDDGTGAGAGDDDPLNGVDAALTALVETKTATAPFMLNTGFVGHGVYALERMPRPSARRCLAAVVAKLVAAAEPAPGDGACWRIRGQWMVDASGDPADQFHTGIRSGAAGAIALLCAADRWGIPTARDTAMRGLAWLWRQRRESRLPAVAGGDAGSGYAHGGAATAAALVANEPDPTLHDRAIAIGLGAIDVPLARDPDGSTTVSLEGGAAGDALAFMRLHAATRDERFARAARHRLDALLDAYDPAIALGGYRFHVPAWEASYDAAIPTGYRELPGISFGVAGIALALLAAVTPVEPAWDRMFLLSARAPAEVS